MVGYASKLLKDRDGAADIVQQLFVNLWEKRDSIVVEGSVNSYLLRATHNQCLNQIKHEKVKIEHASYVIATEAVHDFQDQLEAQEFQMRVNSLVQKLPTQCRKIFLMSRLQEKKYQQIADELHISVKTVENQMGKALKTLRTSLVAETDSTLRIIKTIFWFIIGVNVFSIVMK